MNTSIKPRLARIREGMLSRCYNENSRYYCNYGGRGIGVCEQWKKSLKSFTEWAHANGYLDDLSIDRLNNDCDYEPGNCRWATRLTQQNNMRNNIKINAWGEIKTLTDWTIDPRCAVERHVLTDRVGRLKWIAEEAISTPKHGKRHQTKRRKDQKQVCSKPASTMRENSRHKLLTIWGETMNMKDWSLDPRCKVNYNTLKLRVWKGWDAENAVIQPLCTRKKSFARNS